MPHTVTIIGPRELRRHAGQPVISTVSHATDWSRGLSPFLLGPCRLYGGRRAMTVENGWQFSKLFAPHCRPEGGPSAAYWAWAEAGWANPRAVRYPMGKGAIPVCSLWNGMLLDYLSAREEVYFPLYRDAVRVTAAWRRLKTTHAAGPVTLFDFDGYDHDAQGMSLADVLGAAQRKLGHAFVLKAMLLLGEDVTPAAVRQHLTVRPTVPSADLFALT